MQYNNYQSARDAAWRLLIDTHASTLPIPLSPLFEALGVTAKSYSRAVDRLDALGRRDIARRADGFTLRRGERYMVFYRDACSPQRQRFTLGHELDHIILGHLAPGQITTRNADPAPGDAPQETAANVVAARLLAPACVLHFAGITTPQAIASACNISPGGGFSRQAVGFVGAAGRAVPGTRAGRVLFILLPGAASLLPI